MQPFVQPPCLFFGVYRCSYLKLSKSVCLRVQKKRGAKVMGKVSQTASCSIRKESLEQIAFRNCIHCKQKFILNIKVEHSEQNGSKDPKENNKKNIPGGVLFQINLFWEQHRGKKAAKDCLSTFKRLPLLEIHFKSCFSRALFHEYLQTITSNQMDGVLKT